MQVFKCVPGIYRVLQGRIQLSLFNCYFRKTISCSPPRLLYRPAQLLTVSPSNTLHVEAYWLFSSQEFDKKQH